MKRTICLLTLAALAACAFAVSAQTNPPAPQAEISVQAVPATNPPTPGPSPVASPQAGAVIPLIVMDDVPLTDAIKNLARQAGVKSIEPCTPEVANRHSGYLVGGTSPFGTRKRMPVYIERSILDLPRIWINGGRRGYLVGIAPGVCNALLEAIPVDCALE